jgi:hypothetical protein
MLPFLNYFNMAMSSSIGPNVFYRLCSDNFQLLLLDPMVVIYSLHTIFHTYLYCILYKLSDICHNLILICLLRLSLLFSFLASIS